MASIKLEALLFLVGFVVLTAPIEIAPGTHTQTEYLSATSNKRKTARATDNATGSSCPVYTDVTLHGGVVRGVWEVGTGTSGPFCYASFTDIPYAAPPLAQNRFKAPILPKPWGNFSALKPSPPCPQYSFPGGQLIGDEDCLYLHVYTPSIGSKPKPVMVYIHGGGFTFGSGDRSDLGPDFLISNQVVLVTFNYRLGPFGFLNLDYEGIPGNAGLKDQAFVLEWVHNNIHLFDGDASRVTIFGNSAGAASAHMHTLSKRSEGLFHGAILQSGSAIAGWAYTESHKKRALFLAELLGAPSNSSLAEVENTLKSARAYDVIKAAKRLIDMDPDLRFSRSPPFVPSPERRSDLTAHSEPKFLESDPEFQLKKPAVNPVPMIVGISAVEGLYVYYYSGLVKLPDGISITDMHFDKLLPGNLFPSKDTADLYKVPPGRSDVAKIALAERALRTHYVGGAHFNVENKEKLIEYLGDVFTMNDVHRAITLQLPRSNAPVYLYLFDFNGDYNVARKQLGIAEKGVTHTDELGYLFKMSSLPLKQDPTADTPSAKTIRLLTTMWTNFAKTKKPVATGSNITWPPTCDAQTEKFHFLNISEKVGVVERSLSTTWTDLYSMFRSKKSD